MNMLNPTADERFEPINTILNKTSYTFYTLTKNTYDNDGSWKITSTTQETKVRMHVFTSTGYNQSKIATYDHSELASKGYMQSPNDWKNIEMTGYVKLNDDNFDPNEKFQWFNRGGIHYTSTKEPNSQPCEGVGYKGNLFYSGDDVRFAKEQWHVSYEFTEKKKAATGSSLIEGKRIEYKFVVYNIEENDDNDGKNNNDGKKTVVKM
jgi:hypothetical protein